MSRITYLHMSTCVCYLASRGLYILRPQVKNTADKHKPLRGDYG